VVANQWRIAQLSTAQLSSSQFDGGIESAYPHTLPMEANREKTPVLTVETFMADVPDASTREELYDLFGDHPMFSPEMLAKAQTAIDEVMEEAGLPTDDLDEIGG